MDNVTFIDIETLGGTQTHAIIDRGNGEFTSMPKSVYDEQQAAQAMPQLMPEEVQIMPEEVEILSDEVEILPEEVQAEPVIPEAQYRLDL